MPTGEGAPETAWGRGLTRTGWGVVALALVGLLVGGWLRYSEMVAAAIGTIVVVVAGWALARRSIPIEVTQRTAVSRVERGDSITVVLVGSNNSTRQSRPSRVGTFLDGVGAVGNFGVIDPGGRADVRLQLPTRRRGRFRVGPMTLMTADPMELANVERRIASTTSVLVHPRVLRLRGPRGTLRPVDSEAQVRNQAAEPMAGFVSLREYVQGDDPRMIHWPTTARRGELMVRETVEFRRPEFTVVIDAGRASSSPEAFEEIVDVGASLAVHALGGGLGVVLRSTNRRHAGTTTAMQRDAEVLDFLTVLDQADGTDVVSVVGLFGRGVGDAALVYITGPEGKFPGSPGRLQVSTIRIGEGAVSGPGVLLACQNAADFAIRWRGTA